MKYKYEKVIVEVDLYFRELEGKLQSLEKEDYLKLTDEEKKNVSIEKISILKPWWSLASKVEKISTNPMTQVLENVSFLKNQIQYYLKSCSIVQLEFERDQDNDERIKNFDQIIGVNGLDSVVILRIAREILKLMAL